MDILGMSLEANVHGYRRNTYHHKIKPMTICPEDIKKMKREFKKKGAWKQAEKEARKERCERKRIEARRIVLNRLARGNYHVLEIVQEHDIDLPKEELKKAADLYSHDDIYVYTKDISQLLLAQWAYEKIGQVDKVKSIDDYIGNLGMVKQRERDLDEKIRELQERRNHYHIPLL